MADTHAHATAAHAEHAHPGTKTYIQIALILFVLTALEVAAYEVTHPVATGGIGALVEPLFIEILLLLSAVKFALVAMFYMHLKSDGKLLTGIFSFSLIVATVVVVGLMLLFYHHYHY